MQLHYHIDQLRKHVDNEEHQIKVERHINAIIREVESGGVIVEKEQLIIFHKICSRMKKYKYQFTKNIDKVDYKILLV
ncbi:hypothetical protein ABW636_21390 [Aquimarina sp. 2201CG1-2-11]|uniref:hypothetical protein n=1 Tax=Aquimarina discodermiae TaxID=3231043 RepID=UPI003461E013